MTRMDHQITALQLWLAAAPQEALFKRGVAKSGMDAGEVWKCIELERLALLQRIKDLMEKEHETTRESNVTYITTRKQVIL